MLYLVATPIGNLGDFSPRAQEVLASADVVFCEDTRHSRPLLERAGVHGRILSLHEHNEVSRTKQVLEMLRSGASVALVSDAGLPGVCDPGGLIVQAVRASGFPITVIPGPCAFMTLWPALGWNLPFQFIGFLPHAEGEVKELLTESLLYGGCTLFYESPHRILKTLSLLAKLAPHRPLAAGRELTKKFEEIRVGTTSELLQWVKETPPLGEWCLALQAPPEEEVSWLKGSFIEQCEFLESHFQCDRMQSIKTIAKLNKVSKKTIYKDLLAADDSQREEGHTDGNG